MAVGRNYLFQQISPPTRKDRSYALVAGTDAMLNSSYVISSPSDCQNPAAFNKTMIEGNILICGYSYNFAYGDASIRRLLETAKSLGAVGFILAVESPSPGTKFDPVPVGIPGIVIKEVDQTQVLVDYYNRSTIRDSSGQIKIWSKGFHWKWVEAYISRYSSSGEGFAMISGTSMATPHLAGIAALVKQKHPDWSPTSIKSALQTTSTVVDHMGKPLQTQNQAREDSPISLIAATPFDCGSGAVKPKAALDPGLIFYAGYEDYVSFLFSVPGIDRNDVASITSSTCAPKIGRPTDLNTPSITVSNLIGSMTILRRVTNVAQTEKYTISSSMPPDLSVTIRPSVLVLKEGKSKSFWVTLSSKSPTGTYSFGELLLKGDRGHNVRMPVAVLAK